MNKNNYFEEIGVWPHAGKLMRAYAVGFVLSLALTFLAYLMATHHVLPQLSLMIALIILACAQFGVQLMCFLHLGKETASRERLIILSSATFIVLILVSGSLWIMFHLNERMMGNPTQMEQYMDDEQGI